MKRKNRIKRYFAVFKRNLRRITRKKVSLWLKRNFKSHPFILGFLIFAWVTAVLTKAVQKTSALSFLKTTLLFLLYWLILVVLSNLLKDKQGVKWYFKKRFVFFMLLVLAPVGMVFLWSGAKFKRLTKIILSIIFSLIFLISNIVYYKNYAKLLAKSPLERTIEMITTQSKKVFLKTLESGVLKDLELTVIPKKSREKLAISDVARRCLPGVVSIKTKDKEGKEMGMGSGFIISQDGFIVTNFHVIAESSDAEIKIGEDIFKEVYLVKAVPDLDIAVLKINAKHLAALPIGDSDKLVNGQFVITLGNPWGFERSVSSGIVSALRSKGEMKLIQLTAPVSPGSSGGPLLNEYAEVVGITTIASLFMAQNLNFAIPINYLNKIIKEK